MRIDRKWLEMNDTVFERQIIDWFTAMNKPAIAGGYRESTRKEHVQQATDMVADYARYNEGNTDPGNTAYTRNAKFRALSRAHMSIFKTQLPQPGRSIAESIKLRNLLEEKEIMLNKKLELLKFWGDDSLSDAFLQGDPEDVQWSLTQLYDDAKKKVDFTVEQWSYTSWAGIRVQKSGKVISEDMRRVLMGEMSVEMGAKAEGQVEMEWKGIKGQAKFEAFAGLRGGMSGSVEVGKSGFNAQAQANAELGFKLTASASLETDLVLLGGEVEAFAGAMAKGNASIKIGTGGLSIAASGSAFAGVKASARGFMTIKFKGFEIATVEGTGEVSAGAGGEASFKFEASIYGKTSFSCSASATLGVGAGVSTGIECNLNNLRLAGTAFVYEDVRQFYMKQQHRYLADLMIGDKGNRMMHEQTIAGVKALLDKVQMQQKSASSLVDRAFAKN